MTKTVPFPDASTKTPQIESALVLFFATLLVAGFVVALAWIKYPYQFDVDSKWYIDIAEGRIAEVGKPFINRVLHPLIAEMLIKTFSVSTNTAFVIVAMLSLSILVGSITRIAGAYIPAVWVVALLVSPLMGAISLDYYLPDLFHAAILATFFLCLFNRRFGLSICLLFLLNVTRESTILLTLVVFALSAYARWWKMAVGSIVATVLGIAITAYAAHFGQPNIHHINDAAYILLKIPYNFLNNVLGIVLWTNTLAANNPIAFSHAPQWATSLPASWSFGLVRSVGIYEWNPNYPVSTLIMLLSTFGILPTFVFRNLLNADVRQQILPLAPFWLMVALIYGLMSFLLGTSTGASVERLVGYGWPCFFLAAPFMLSQLRPPGRKRLVIFICSISFLTSWIASLAGNLFGSSLGVNLLVACVLLALHGWALREINRSAVYGQCNPLPNRTTREERGP